MSKPKIIQKLIQKYEEHQSNVPKYKIEDLHVGEIIYVADIKYYKGPTLLTSGIQCTYKGIKRFAVFYKNPFNSEYIHIVTGQPLDLDFHCDARQYCINSESLRDFDKAMQRYMIKNNLKKSSKLSINEIKEIEKTCNEHLYPNKKPYNLFG